MGRRSSAASHIVFVGALGQRSVIGPTGSRPARKACANRLAQGMGIRRACVSDGSAAREVIGDVAFSARALRQLEDCAPTARARAGKIPPLLPMCFPIEVSGKQQADCVYGKSLISMVGAQGLEPWTR